MRALWIATIFVADVAYAQPKEPAKGPPPKVDCVECAGELHQRIKTQTPRVKLSAFLVPLAKKAEKKTDWATAIPIYQALVAARGVVRSV